MNSRERLLKAISCEIPDRVPICTDALCGYNSSSWEYQQPSYANLLKYVKEKTDCVAKWSPKSSEQFFSSSYNAPCKVKTLKGEDWVSWQYYVETPKGVVSSTTKVFHNVNTHWITEPWCKDIDDVDKVLSIPYEPVKYDFKDYDRIRSEVGDQGIVMASISDPLGCAVQLMEFGEATVWAMTETDHFAKTVEIMQERVMENLKNLLDAQVVDLYRIYGPEYATIPYLPPSYFARFVTPYVREMTDLIHRKGAKVRVHSHGKVKNVVPMILDTGADSMDPCEAPPDGDITLRELKEMTCGRISLFGNVQLKLLEHGNIFEIREEVKRCMEAAKQGGGYIIMPTASPINTPLSPKTEENYYAYMEAALEYGAY